MDIELMRPVHDPQEQMYVKLSQGWHISGSVKLAYAAEATRLAEEAERRKWWQFWKTPKRDLLDWAQDYLDLAEGKTPSCVWKYRYTPARPKDFRKPGTPGH